MIRVREANERRRNAENAEQRDGRKTLLFAIVKTRHLGYLLLSFAREMQKSSKLAVYEEFHKV